MGLLLERWAQSTEGHGQVVLLSGEAGIGKSRLVEVLRERVGRERATWLTFRCSPYHTNSALYPVITHLQRVLQLRPEETPAARLDRLEHALRATRLPLEEAVPLVAALLSVPLAERYPPLDWSPAKAEAEDARSPGGLAGGGGRAPAGAGGVGRPALGRSLDAGVARPGPGPDAHGPAVSPADLSPGVSPAVGAPLLSDPAHPGALDAPAGRGDGPAGDGRQARCRPRWCSRLWPRPTACRCLWKS